MYSTAFLLALTFVAEIRQIKHPSLMIYLVLNEAAIGSWQ